MGSWINGVWRWEIEWRRAPFEREKPIEKDLLDLVGKFVLKEGVADTWRWRSNGAGKFLVSDAYKEILRDLNRLEGNHGQGVGVARVWKTIAPFKAQISAWRLLWNKLPTCDMLGRRFDLSPKNKICKCCNIETESAAHRLLACPKVEGIWHKMLEWVGTAWATPREVNLHFQMFTGLLKGKGVRRRLGGLWICVVWVVWKWRNACVFDNKEWDFRRIEEEIKCRFWNWCLVKGMASCDMSFVQWSSIKLHDLWMSL